MTNKHCKWAPSSADRWFKCRGSVELEQVQTRSVHASRGTKGHALAESILKGRRMTWDNQDLDLLDAVSEYTEWVKSRDGVPYIEEKLSANIGGHEVYGTPDAVVARNYTADVPDLKLGYQYVHPNCNQLKVYGLMVHKVFASCEVNLVVVQPAREPVVREYCMDLEMLEAFEAEMVAAMDAPVTFVPGTHCKWCPGSISCPAMHGIILALQKDGYDNMDKETKSEYIRYILDNRDAIKAHLADVENQAVTLIGQGLTDTGYKVQPKFGRRKWVDETAVRKYFEDNCDLQDGQKIPTPSQAKKIVGDDFVNEHSECPKVGVKLTHDDTLETLESFKASIEDEWFYEDGGS